MRVPVVAVRVSVLGAVVVLRLATSQPVGCPAPYVTVALNPVNGPPPPPVTVTLFSTLVPPPPPGPPCVALKVTVVADRMIVAGAVSWIVWNGLARPSP